LNLILYYSIFTCHECIQYIRVSTIDPHRGNRKSALDTVNASLKTSRVDVIGDKWYFGTSDNLSVLRELRLHSFARQS